MNKQITEWAEDFYSDVEPIVLKDPLAELLGAVKESGSFVYNYTDAVLMAGHSCPAVSGAYKLTMLALKALYGSETPERGNIRIMLKGKPDELAYGPQSQVIMLITGASGNTGFKGLGGKYSRKNLLHFDHTDFQFNTYIFRREDTEKTVQIVYNPQVIPEDPRLSELTPKAISGEATESEAVEFRKLWQEKIKKILINDENFPGLFEVTELTDFIFPMSY